MRTDDEILALCNEMKTWFLAHNVSIEESLEAITHLIVVGLKYLDDREEAEELREQIIDMVEEGGPGLEIVNPGGKWLQ